MASVLRIKRRVSGAAGAPASLMSGELAYNMSDGIIYIGYGDNGSGGATSIRAIAKDNYTDHVGLYQPVDADLTAIADLDATAGLLAKTAANTYARRTITGTAGRVSVSNGDAQGGNPTIDLATVTAGSNVAGGYTKITFDSYGRISNAGQASLNDIATATADYSLGGFKLTSVGAPTAAGDAVNKSYVDNAIQGIDAKESVLAASTSNVDVSSPGPTLDGVTLTNPCRILLKDQSAPHQNGIYTWTNAAAPLTRTSDADTWNELRAAFVFVEQGTAHGEQGWLCTVDAGGTLNSTNITFVQFSGTGSGGFAVAGDGLTAAGTTINVAAGTGITVASDNVALTGQALALHQVATAANKLIYATGAGAFTTTDLTSTGRSLIGGTDASAMRTTLGLVPGTDVQAYNLRLANLAGLGISSADTIVLYGATNAVSQLTLGATGKALLDDATQGDARTTLGLGSMATQNSSSVTITGGSIDGVTLDGGTF